MDAAREVGRGARDLQRDYIQPMILGNDQPPFAMT
jgi:hypothetical protein